MEEQKVVLPDDARESLRVAGVLRSFDELSLSRQREFVTSIQGANPEARPALIEKMVAALGAKT